MKYCTNCGNKLNENQAVCLNCGVLINNNKNLNQNIETDNGGIGWSLLGFLIPIVGLILYLVWKDEKPITSKAAGKGALVSFIVSAVLSVLTFFLYMILIMVFITV